MVFWDLDLADLIWDLDLVDLADDRDQLPRDECSRDSMTSSSSRGIGSSAGDWIQ